MSAASNAAKRIVPLLDRVLVQRVKPAERTASGLFIPEKAQQTLNEGVVLAAGPGMINNEGKVLPMHVSAGDRVLLPEYGGNLVKLGEEEFHLFRDSEILAKLNKA
ncbi:chaperonin 10 kDa subunit [Catenaria anguillulae PL171]|uniref:Chaperonin 10 kDa subunit n=1 Tax=Catenaria anguillulae PL171 TaxID=765915 RepID=A0A1Y2HW94_9FUNG|nr:chaperonin 10 kDa subunit [Catenaria anguillulae PL171]